MNVVMVNKHQEFCKTTIKVNVKNFMSAGCDEGKIKKGRKRDDFVTLHIMGNEGGNTFFSIKLQSCCG